MRLPSSPRLFSIGCRDRLFTLVSRHSFIQSTFFLAADTSSKMSVESLFHAHCVHTVACCVRRPFCSRYTFPVSSLSLLPSSHDPGLLYVFPVAFLMMARHRHVSRGQLIIPVLLSSSTASLMPQRRLCVYGGIWSVFFSCKSLQLFAWSKY